MHILYELRCANPDFYNTKKCMTLTHDRPHELIYYVEVRWGELGPLVQALPYLKVIVLGVHTLQVQSSVL
jgi:hypothetical protein